MIFFNWLCSSFSTFIPGTHISSCIPLLFLYSFFLIFLIYSVYKTSTWKNLFIFSVKYFNKKMVKTCHNSIASVKIRQNLLEPPQIAIGIVYFWKYLHHQISCALIIQHLWFQRTEVETSKYHYHF